MCISVRKWSLHFPDNVRARLGESHLKQGGKWMKLDRFEKCHIEYSRSLIKYISLSQVDLLSKFTAVVFYVHLSPEPVIGANVQGINPIPLAGAAEEGSFPLL